MVKVNFIYEEKYSTRAMQKFDRLKTLLLCRQFSRHSRFLITDPFMSWHHSGCSEAGRSTALTLVIDFDHL